MSVLDEVLLEEYERSLRIKNAIELEQKSLPKGSVQLKIIHNTPCYYLVYRDGPKIKSQYIKNRLVENYKELVQQRRENERHIRELNANLKKIVKALGKDVVNEYTANRIH